MILLFLEGGGGGGGNCRFVVFARFLKYVCWISLKLKPVLLFFFAVDSSVFPAVFYISVNFQKKILSSLKPGRL